MQTDSWTRSYKRMVHIRETKTQRGGGDGWPDSRHPVREWGSDRETDGRQADKQGRQEGRHTEGHMAGGCQVP